MQVRCIKWSPDDTHLLSCSLDGAVYDWSVRTCKREREYVLKSCSYTSLAFTSDLKTTFAVGSDRTLNQINLQDSSVSIVASNYSSIPLGSYCFFYIFNHCRISRANKGMHLISSALI